MPFSDNSDFLGLGGGPQQRLANKLTQVGLSLAAFLVNQGASIQLVLSFPDTAPLSNSIASFESINIYFIPSSIVGNQDIYSLGLATFYSKRQFVLTLSPKAQRTIVLVPFLTYSGGGWFFAAPLVGGIESPEAYSNPCPVPLSTTYSIPTREVTNQVVQRTIFTKSSITYNTLNILCNGSVIDGNNAGATFNSFAVLQILINNYRNAGLTETLGFIYYSGANNTADVINGKFTLECDDGTGGWPNPGAHACTIYFVSCSAAFTHRNDVTSAPSINLATGIHS